MEKRRARRSYATLGEIKQRQLEYYRRLIKEELPDLIARNQRHHDALKEKTFSGDLRRAIRDFPLSARIIAEKAGISWIELDDFLTGDKPLASDVVDRLAAILKLRLQTQKNASKPRTAKAS